MTPFEALILGIVQGITEFFPVSSSGHLQIMQYLFGYQDLEQYIIFDLVCHLGTLASIFLVFGSDIRNLLFKDRQRLGQIALAILPLFPLLLIMKPIKSMFNQPQYLGYCFLTTALLLWLGMKFGREKPGNKWRDALVIGGFQALAILPGISRSGSTISGARLLGWAPSEALTFSFLLAIPTILGGTVLEVAKLMKVTELPPVSATEYIIGCISSFVVGTACLIALKTLVRKQSFLYFAWYCLLIGIWALWAFN